MIQKSKKCNNFAYEVRKTEGNIPTLKHILYSWSEIYSVFYFIYIFDINYVTEAMPYNRTRNW